MMMNIQIVKKPEWVSWDDIKQCLVQAHTVNKTKGINMSHYQWSAEEIKEFVGDTGFMLVALDGKNVVGTAAIKEKFGKSWYVNGRYAYICFASVLPDYNGLGIYKKLAEERERIAKEQKYRILLLDTHARNKHIQAILKKNGYRYVRCFLANDKNHYSVIMAKWLDGCPFSHFFCWLKFQQSKMKTLIKFVL